MTTDDIGLPALLDALVEQSKIPRDFADRLLAWADDIRRRQVAGELTDAEVDRAITRKMADEMARAELEGWWRPEDEQAPA